MTRYPKMRGLLDETLIICGGEVGRTPFREGRTAAGNTLGRGHFPDCFTMWMAGGGVKGGAMYSKSDDLVLAVMASPLESVSQAVMLLVALPFALAGVIWTLYIMGVDLDQPGAVVLNLLILTRISFPSPSVSLSLSGSTSNRVRAVQGGCAPFRSVRGWIGLHLHDANCSSRRNPTRDRPPRGSRISSPQLQLSSVSAFVREGKRMPENVDSIFDRFRGYLHVLARSAIGPGWERRFDASDVVQETLLEAHRNRHQIRGQETGQVAGWLRTILKRNIGQAMRNHQRARRDLRREVPLDHLLDQSTVRLASCFPAARGPSPSQRAQQEELSVQAGEALLELTDSQQEAIYGLYIEGLPIDEVARRMGRNATAVTMLVRRSLAQLREALKVR